MTTRTVAVGLLGALLMAPPTMAQTPMGQPPADDSQAGTVLDPNLRSVDFGVRLTDVDGDEARFNRYRDNRTGPALQGFRWTSETDARLWRVEADNVGYRDQRFGATVEQFGRFKGWFEYNQIPYEQDYSTRTPFSVVNNTTLTVDDALQSAIGAGQATLNPAVEGFASPFELRTKRDITTLGGQYQLNRHTDINFALISTGRKGHQPWGSSFGMGSTFEVPAPIEQRNTEIAANVEWANKKAMFKAGYDGSLFNSEAESLTFDNPLRLTNATNASSLGRLARWPSSTMHTLSATGSLALPAKSRLIAYVARSAMTSDVDLLPWTINPAITQPSLPRTSLDAEAEVTTVLLRFNSRPTRWAWFNASYRSYDLDNNTTPFQYDQKVSFDASLVNSPGESSHPYSFARGTFELDGSFTPWRNGAFRIGYVREDVDRTNRIYETTVEDSFRAGYDWTSNRWVTVRAGVVSQKRRGKGFDAELLASYSEQPGMRHADLSNRDRNMGQAVVTFLPTSTLSLNVNGSVGTDDRPDGDFGLRSQDFSTIGFGVDFSPSDAFTMGASYLYETFSSLETSRTANPPPDPTFFDARRNWSDDIDEDVSTVNAYFEAPKLFGKLDFGVNYDYTKADTSFFYSVVANSTLPTPQQLNPVYNDWTQARVTTAYWLRRNLSLGLTYMYDQFGVNDWALGTQTLDRLAHSNTFLLMNYGWENYTAHTVWLKATYLW
jgi:MtrB/PioB family decaheme-associated outer membrane protein